MWSVWEQNMQTLIARKIAMFPNRTYAKTWVDNNRRVGYEYYVLHTRKRNFDRR